MWPKHYAYVCLQGGHNSEFTPIASDIDTALAMLAPTRLVWHQEQAGVIPTSCPTAISTSPSSSVWDGDAGGNAVWSSSTWQVHATRTLLIEAIFFCLDFFLGQLAFFSPSKKKLYFLLPLLLGYAQVRMCVHEQNQHFRPYRPLNKKKLPKPLCVCLCVCVCVSVCLCVCALYLAHVLPSRRASRAWNEKRKEPPVGSKLVRPADTFGFVSRALLAELGPPLSSI